jgi:hypothetical protein
MPDDRVTSTTRAEAAKVDALCCFCGHQSTGAERVYHYNGEMVRLGLQPGWAHDACLRRARRESRGA